MPGAEESPFMTWGQLDSTPMRAMTPGNATPGNATPGSHAGSNAPAPSSKPNPLSNAPAFRMGDSKF